MIEIYRKGFRLDIPADKIVTFKKSINLNGIQERYAYSNNFTIEKTANNLKLLDLPDAPIGKLNSLQNGYLVDVVLNGSIQLKDQTLKITKESKSAIDIYLLFTDNALISNLKTTYVNDVVKDFKYKKTIQDFKANGGVFLNTQPDSGIYVVEEIPKLLNLQSLIIKLFTDNNYTVYGDFTLLTNTIKDYFVAPNAGIYQIYSGSGDGFSPSFESTLTAYDLLNQSLAFFNCYASVDDTYRTVIINRWDNLGNYKTSYKDYSKYYVDYKDYTFQSKLAKKNELTYSDSGTSFNSFFTNNLSSQEKETYLNSAFGTGSAKLFDNSEIQEDGTIPLRYDGEIGETSAVRIYKISDNREDLLLFEKGVSYYVSAKKAISVSMRNVYNEFHKDYTAFILTPLIQNVIFKYNDILVNEFSLAEVFFIEQLSSYWIPLEINFSTKKDEINIKSMLIKQRKVASPILNNFNSVLLDFKQKVIFTKDFLLSMYAMPPNEFEWDEVIFKRYDDTLNSLFVNGELIPSSTMPRVFSISELTENSIVFEANKQTDSTPDKNTDSLYIQAVDSNGGLSNEAYINIKHTGVASYESNFEQIEDYNYTRTNFDGGSIYFNVLEYVVGNKPNINNTIDNRTVNKPPVTGSGTQLKLIQAIENYTHLKINIKPINIKLKTTNGGIGKARATLKLQLYDGVNVTTLQEWRSANKQEQIFITPEYNFTYTNFPQGRFIEIYFYGSFDNRRGLNSGNMDVYIDIKNMKASISTIKTL